jgi:acetyl-CoA carboxylase carboxyl transferase subunit beta
MSDTPPLPEWVQAPEWMSDLAVSDDPLGFPGYREQLQRTGQLAGASDSVTPACARIGGCPVIVAAFDFGFMGGSMGEATGRRLEAAIDLACRRRVLFVSITRSGGARMQEGMRSLLQMQRIAAALRRLRDAGVPHLSVARHPTTGGIWASLVSAADVIVAEEGATVAFSGARVRGVAVDGAEFTALGKLDSGAVDVVCDADELGDTVERCTRVLSACLATPPERCGLPAALEAGTAARSGWAAVRRARGADRPRSDAYLAAYFDEIMLVSGDRCGGRDLGMRCGIGLRDGQAVAFAAQTGSANSAAGFRTATRTLRLSDALRIPALTLIDTPGARNDARAEREGIGTAIAETFTAVASISVPVTTLLVGEGGSGGALALAAPGHMWAVPSSYFSVIAPEAAAAILHRDRHRAAEVADALRVGPKELVELGVVRGVVEPAASPAIARAVRMP